MKSIAVIAAFVAVLAIGSAQDWGKMYDALPLYAKISACWDPSMPADKVKCVGRAIGYEVLKGKENVEQTLKRADSKIKDFVTAKKAEIHQYLASNEFTKETHEKAHELKDKSKEKIGKVKDWFKEKFGRD